MGIFKKMTFGKSDDKFTGVKNTQINDIAEDEDSEADF